MKIQNQSRCKSDPPLSDIDFKNKLFLVWTTLNIIRYLTRQKRLTAEKLYLIQPSTSSSDGILWCEIVVSSFFSEYFFEGLKPEDYPNEEIILEMPTDDFHRALKIDRPDKTIPTTLKLKLSREDFAAGQKRAHETTVGGSKQPVIVIQLNLQQASTGRDPRTVHKAFARMKVSIPTKAKY